MKQKLLDDIDANALTVLGAFTRTHWLAYCARKQDKYARHSCADNLPAGELPAGELFVIVASVGGGFWQKFTDAMPDAMFGKAATAHPFDDYSKSVLHKITQPYGANYYHPSDRPYLPFQQYCMMLNDVYAMPLFHRSPLGILFHQHYGLWYGLRGLLALSNIGDKEIVAWQDAVKPLAIADGVRHNDCANCQNQPCVASCPAMAVRSDFFDVEKCCDYIVETLNHCTNSCVARGACPYGRQHRYPSEKLTYLMRTRIKNAIVG
ncbi:MAG: hypothetical protein K0U45_02345 [Alphaproteobacteria bacterium]|nr:hypothetical protein [Alphaproteobacteria bacterium]